MSFMIPKNCQIRADGHTMTFAKDMHATDTIRVMDVLEIDGSPALVEQIVPPALMNEVVAMICGRHPIELQGA